jgi:hypothetical protein
MGVCIKHCRKPSSREDLSEVSDCTSLSDSSRDPYSVQCDLELQVANFDSLDDLPQQMEVLLRDGVPESVFWSMFVQCSACKIVTATSVFEHLHSCSHRQRYDASVRELQAYTQAKRRRMEIRGQGRGRGSGWHTPAYAMGPMARHLPFGASDISGDSSAGSVASRSVSPLGGVQMGHGGAHRASIRNSLLRSPMAAGESNDAHSGADADSEHQTEPEIPTDVSSSDIEQPN